MYPVIVCIAKKEHDYIEEFVKYHLALGFKHIYLYDNEDIPTYENLLHKYKENITVFHIPIRGVQCIILQHFMQEILFKENNITHYAHIDIDEFIVLKKHKNICDFINDYLVGDCQAIGMNWRIFGSSGKTEKTNEPNIIRFTMCEKNGNEHVKIIAKKDNVIYIGIHDVVLSNGYTKSTNNHIIKGPFNYNIDLDVIQLNHYKCKTLPEFRYIRTRQKADVAGDIIENVDENFKIFDINEVEDLTAYNFYKSII
jgi:hypothetical protein